MASTGHLEWMVPYNAGSIKAVGYKNGKKYLEQTRETTEKPAQLVLEPHKTGVLANGEDLAIFSVSAVDNKGRFVPTANNKVFFEIEGPAKIIGVGNGDNTCLEPDKYIDDVSVRNFINMKAKVVDGIENRLEISMGFDDGEWAFHFQIRDEIQKGTATVYRGTFNLPENLSDATVNLYYKAIGDEQVLYINGEPISEKLEKKSAERYSIELDKKILKTGENEFSIVATPYTVPNRWDAPNTNPGVIQVVVPAQQYNRSLFNGYAQVIVQTTKEPGTIVLKAYSENIKGTEFFLNSNKAELRPSVD